MLHFLVGPNQYCVAEKLAQLTKAAQSVEQVDGETLDQAALFDLVQGQQLFSPHRTIIIRDLSSNKPVWSLLERIVSCASEDAAIIFVEPAPDKRTASYKWLKDHAEMTLCEEPTEKDRNQIISWLIEEAKGKGATLERQAAAVLLERVGLHQLSLAQAITMLAVRPAITVENIESAIPPSSEDNGFRLLSQAINGQTDKIQYSIGNLRRSENAYRVFGLLASQLQQCALLVHGQNDVRQIASDLSISEYGLRRQAEIARHMTQADVQAALAAAAHVDSRMKSTDVDPWDLVEQCLLTIAFELKT